MRKDITVAAETRSARGKNEMNRLRVKGFSPSVIYGAGGDSVLVRHERPKELSPSPGNGGLSTLFARPTPLTIPRAAPHWWHDFLAPMKI